LSALTKQVAPSPDEQTVLPYENADPLGASLYMPAASGGKKAGKPKKRRSAGRSRETLERKKRRIWRRKEEK